MVNDKWLVFFLLSCFMFKVFKKVGNTFFFLVDIAKNNKIKHLIHNNNVLILVVQIKFKSC